MSHFRVAADARPRSSCPRRTQERASRRGGGEAHDRDDSGGATSGVEAASGAAARLAASRHRPARWGGGDRSDGHAEEGRSRAFFCRQVWGGGRD
jgi:hypothetical protein